MVTGQQTVDHRRDHADATCAFRVRPVRQWAHALAVVVCAALVAGNRPLGAQSSRLVVPVPDAPTVPMQSESFTGPDGAPHRFDVYRPDVGDRAVAVVIFVNVVGPQLREWPGYVDWARLVTRRNLAGVLYDGPTYDMNQSPDANQRIAEAYADSLLSAVRRASTRLRIDGTNVVLWAASANTSAGTPVALSGERSGISGYVLYYGAGAVRSPRIDVPVFVARAGLDAPELNRQLDSLTAQLIASGVTVTLANYPGGRHGFDVLDSTAVTANIIEQTLNFAQAATSEQFRRAIRSDTLEVRAARAFTEQRWPDAVRLYQALAAHRPQAAGIAWRLGLAQLENESPAAALVAFGRARQNGQGGARDLGIPAVRAALRSGNIPAAVEWTRWALRAFPRIRADFAADTELAPMLDHPEVKGAGLREAG